MAPESKQPVQIIAAPLEARVDGDSQTACVPGEQAALKDAIDLGFDPCTALRGSEINYGAL
jgi:hypothetical protein